MTLEPHTRRVERALLLALGMSVASCKADAGAQAVAETLAAGGSSTSNTGTPPGTCDSAPLGPLDALLDDFEDGDGEIHAVPERRGYWWVAADGTGGSVVPPADHVLPALSDDGRRAMHFAARGFTDWAALLGIMLRWHRGYTECPFNATPYAGLWLRAKGTGSLPVSVSTPKTLPASEGGNCVGKCFDHYSRVIQLNPDWTRYELRWSQLQQDGWGTPAALDLTHMLGLVFDPLPQDLPVDVWIDDVGFLLPEADTQPAQRPQF